MGWFNDAVDKAKDTVDKAVDEAEDKVQGATGIDFGGSGGGKNADDVTDTNEDTSKGVTDNPEKAVSEAKKGVGEAVDKAEDTVQETTGRDFGGSGGGSSDNDTETTESTFDSDGGAGGGGGSPEPEPEPQPKTQKKGNSKDKAPQTQEQLKKFLGLGKQKTKNAAKRLNKAVNKSEARDPDILNDDFAKEGGRLFETGAERQLSYASSGWGDLGSKEFNNRMRAENFFTGRDRKEKAQDQINQLDQQIENIRNAEASQFVIDTTPNEEGGEKTFSKNELIDTLQQDKSQLKKDVETISENQVKRLENIGTVNDQISKDRNTITEKEADKIAKKQDLSEKGIQANFLGKNSGKVKGGVAEASIIFDTAFSSNSGELLGASVDQFIGSDEGDKTVEQVAEKNSIMAGQRLEKQGFNPVDEAVDTLTSIPGIVTTSLVGGAAFSGGSKAIASLPKIGSTAQKVYQGAGAVAGAYTVGKQGQKTKQQLEAGNEAEAVGTITETGAGLYGFYKGQKGFNTYLGARTGTTRINQKNLLRKTGKDSAQGFGRFEGRTVVEKPAVRDYLDLAMGKGFRPKTEVIESTGRYRIPTASEGSSQAQGQIRFNSPSGSSKTQGFEVLSNVRQTGNTRSGNQYRLSSDNVRFKSEGRLFQNFRDQTQLTKSVRQSKSQSSAQEVTNQFENVPVSKDSFIQKVRLSGTNSKSDSFSDTTNFIVGKGSSGGSAGSSGGQGLRTGTKGGRAGSTNVRVRDVVNSEAQSYVTSQNPGKVPNTGSYSVVSGGNTQGKQGGSGQEQGGSQAQTFNAGLSGENLQNFRQNVYGSRSIEPVTESGGQQTKEGGTQITSRTGGSSTGSTEVTSKASNIIQDKKDRLSTNQPGKTRPTGKTGQRPRIGTNLRQSQGNRLGIGQVGKVGQSLEITNTTKTGVKPVQMLKTRQIQKTQQKQLTGLKSLTTSSTTITPQVRPGIGGIPSLELSGTRGPTGPATSSTGPTANIGGGRELDWFSANLVEQSTDEQARFDLSATPRNKLFGLKTTKERSGEVEDTKILDGNNNGGNNIW